MQVSVALVMSSQEPSPLLALYLEILCWRGLKGEGTTERCLKNGLLVRKPFPVREEGSRLDCSGPPVPSTFHPLVSPCSTFPTLPGDQLADEGLGYGARCNLPLLKSGQRPAWRSKPSLSHCCQGRLSCSNTYQVKPLKSIFVVLLYFPLEHGRLH